MADMGKEKKEKASKEIPKKQDSGMDDIHKKILEMHEMIMKRFGEPKAQAFADKGDVEPIAMPATDPLEPQAPATLAPAAQAPAAQSDDQAYDAALNPQAPDNLTAAIAAPSPMQSMQQQIDQAKQQHNDNMGAELNNFSQDLVNGHITPKTYHDLWSKNPDGSDRGTMSKIGTLFGLLVSGAGSGLAHQTNAVSDMMDNEIKNDLLAQQKSKDNALNFWKVNQADALSKAQAYGGVQNALTAANTLSKSEMEQTMLHKLTQIGKTLPPAQQAKWMAGLAPLAELYRNKSVNALDIAAQSMAAQGINPTSVLNNKQTQGQAPAVAPANQGKPQAPAGKAEEPKDYGDADLRPGSEKTPFTPPPPFLKVDKNAVNRSQMLGEQKTPNNILPSEVAQANQEMALVDRANQFLADAHKQYPEMWKHGGHADALATGLDDAHIMGMQIPNPGAAFPGMKQYFTASSMVKKGLGQLMKNGLTPEMSEQIQKQLVNARDMPDEYRGKIKNFDNIVLQGLETPVLKKYHLIKGFPK